MVDRHVSGEGEDERGQESGETRRRFLLASGAAATAAVAGCFGDDDEDDNTLTMWDHDGEDEDE